MASDAKTRIGEILGRYVTDAGEMDAVLRGDPILTATSLDSLTMINVIVEIERAFGVRFDLDTIEETFATIDSLAAFMDRASGVAAD